jgi:hypothetical protein
MRIWLNPSRLNFLNVSAAQVRQALTENNVIAPIGRIENSQQRIDLQTSATLKTTSEFEQLVISNIDGAIVRLGEVARVELGEVEGNLIARISQRDNQFLAVFGLPGAYELEIGDELYTVLDEVNATLPDGMRIDMGYDGTLYMRDAIQEIFITLGETVLLVGIVVLLFMGSLRSALVPLVTIPISLLGAMAMMMAMGFSFNLLTILAIVLSVGLVVDDAIVVVENVAPPYHIFVSHGFEVDFVSPDGGKVEFMMDPLGISSYAIKYEGFIDKINNSFTPKKIESSNYWGVYVGGGYGPLFDVANNKEIQSIIAKIYESGGSIGGRRTWSRCFC